MKLSSWPWYVWYLDDTRVLNNLKLFFHFHFYLYFAYTIGGCKWIRQRLRDKGENRDREKRREREKEHPVWACLPKAQSKHIDFLTIRNSHVQNVFGHFMPMRHMFAQRGLIKFQLTKINEMRHTPWGARSGQKDLFGLARWQQQQLKTTINIMLPKGGQQFDRVPFIF